jgi:hypothetical protein
MPNGPIHCRQRAVDGLQEFPHRGAPSSRQIWGGRSECGGQYLGEPLLPLVFDEKTGGICSIVDKELDKQLVDAKSARKFNEYLYKRVAKQEEEVGTWYSPTAASLSGKSGPVLGSMTAKVQAEGCRCIEQTVVLYDRIKRIDFVQNFDKAPSGMTAVSYGSAGGRGILVGKEGVL